MSVLNGGTELYPLELKEIRNGGRVVYSRDDRGKAYFFLRLDASVRVMFITSDGEQFKTKNSEIFTVLA